MPTSVVAVFSGLTFGGKSFLREWVMGLPEYAGAQTLAMDPIRRQLFGDRSDTHITKTEHVFKNEVTRFELKKKLIIERPPTVFLEMVMLTRAAHQRPFAEMMDSVNDYLRKIEQEEAQRDGRAPSTAVSVDFRCMYLYCDLEAVRRRIEYRRRDIERSGNTTSASVFDLGGFVRGAQQIEIPPDGYMPLYLNTSDESPGAVAQNQAEVLAFLQGKMPISDQESQRRMAEAVSILTEARTL